MNWLQRVNANLEAFFGEPLPPDPPPPLVRPEFPCGVRDCIEEQVVVRQDERETVVDCPVHDCRTSWETKKREAKELQVIRVQDGWRKHGNR